MPLTIETLQWAKAFSSTMSTSMCIASILLLFTDAEAALMTERALLYASSALVIHRVVRLISSYLSHIYFLFSPPRQYLRWLSLLRHIVENLFRILLPKPSDIRMWLS